MTDETPRTSTTRQRNSSVTETRSVRVNVTLYGPLRSLTPNRTVTLDFDGGTVADALDRFVDAYPRAASQLYDESGTLRPSVRVMYDDERADFDDRCPPDAELKLFPAMRGG